MLRDRRRLFGILEHDPEKWTPVFGKDHAQTIAPPMRSGDRLMAYETIRYEISDEILTITLNRPDKLNAFTTKMLSELIDAFDRADADDGVKAIIITGAGRAFCAGADLSAGGAPFHRPARPHPPQNPTRPGGAPGLARDPPRGGGRRGARRVFFFLN